MPGRATVTIGGTHENVPRIGRRSRSFLRTPPLVGVLSRHNDQMAVDLGSLLRTPELGLTLRYGRTHLDRTVSWVVTTDLPDPRRYLAGGELVLTGMMWRGTAGDSEEFVGYLAAAGAAAIGAGDPEVADLPDDLIAACRRHQLPLFHVRPDVSFSTITEHVVRQVSAVRSADLATVLGRHRSLLEADSDLAGVLDLVAEELGMRCGVLAPTARLLRGNSAVAQQGRDTIVAEVARGAPLPFLLEADGVAYSVFEVRGNAPARRLLVVDDDHTGWAPQRRAVMDELAAMVAMDVEGQLHAAHTDADLLDLLEGDADAAAVAARIRLAGLDPAAPLAVLVLSGTVGTDRLAGLALDLVAGHAEPFAWTTRAAELVVVAQLPATAGEFVPAVAAGALAATVAAGEQVAVGSSEPVVAVEGLVGALTEARHAHRLAAAKPGSVTVAGPDELNGHELLLASVAADVRSTFRSRVLGPLTEYDAQHSSELLRTLEVYLACSGSWAKAAAQLHVHVNTLRYRIERIEKLTGKNLRHLPDLVDLHLALRLR